MDKTAVIFKTGISGPEYGSYRRGDRANIRTEEAERLIEAGIATRAAAEDRETRILAPPETRAGHAHSGSQQQRAANRARTKAK